MEGEGDLAHLPADVRPVALLGAEARIAHIRAERWIQHAAAERLLGYLQEAVDQPARERMENVLLLGESGMGKTMLIRKLERQNAACFDDATGVQRRPVVVMLMPPQPTESEFFNRVLEAIEAPSAGFWSHGGQLRASATRLLREIGTRVLVIDEINSVLAGTPRQQRLFLQLPSPTVDVDAASDVIAEPSVAQLPATGPRTPPPPRASGSSSRFHGV